MIGRRMARVAGLVVAMVAAAPVALSDDNSKQIERVETKTWEFWKAKDKKGYAGLLAEPAVRVTAEGITAGLAKTVALDTNATCSQRHFKLGAMRTHKITDDVYVVTYRALFGETCGGKPAVYKTNYSSTYRKDGDAWKNVVYTETALSD